jgi:hypothetical protein
VLRRAECRTRRDRARRPPAVLAERRVRVALAFCHDHLHADGEPERRSAATARRDSYGLRSAWSDHEPPPGTPKGEPPKGGGVITTTLAP